MAVVKDGKVFLGKGTPSDNKPIGSYEIITQSENPIKVIVKGVYDTKLAPIDPGGGDALHSFESRTKDNFGGGLHTTVNTALKQVYDKGFNPFVSSMKIDINKPKVNWEVEIIESSDGKAYVGLSSRGGAGGTYKTRALDQANDKKKALPNELSPKEPNMSILDVLDYLNEKVAIRQIFFQYTKPNAFPPKPKSNPSTEGPIVSPSGVTASGTGSSASISGTSSIPLNVVFPEKFEVKAREDVPKFTIWVGPPQPEIPVEGFVDPFSDEIDDELEGSEYIESTYSGEEESIEIANFNSVDDEPTGPSAIELEESVDVGKTLIGPGPPAGSKLLKKSEKLYYIVGGSGLAGHRLKPILTDLEKHLNANGYKGTKIGNNGIMRDLVASTYPSSSARAVASLHGAGLAIDVTFSIPGKKWSGIGDNKNLSDDPNLTKVIWNFVKSQGDITWGAEWGGSKPVDGVVKGRGITEYHHFEIKSSKIAEYWKPFEKDLKEMGFDYTKLVSTGKKGEIFKLNKALLNSVGIA